MKNKIVLGIASLATFLAPAFAFASCSVNGKEVPCNAFFSFLPFVFIPLMLIMFGLSIGALIFWIFMLVDAANMKDTDNHKIAWILIIVFTGFIGAVLYYFIIKRARGKNMPTAAMTQVPPPQTPPQQ